MKHTVSLRRAVAVGAMAAATCSLVTGMAVYGVAHPSGELAEIYDALEEVQAIVDSRFVGDYDMDEVRDYVLTGYAEGLGDRWTSYMTEEYYQNYLPLNLLNQLFYLVQYHTYLKMCFHPSLYNLYFLKV